MKVLITGSSGQIGTNLALSLISRGDHVLGVDIRQNPWTKSFHTNIHDLRLSDEMPDEYFDVVVHLAANAKVHELVENPSRALDNVKTCFNVLEFCRKRKIPLIFGSSREVYGNLYNHGSVNEVLANFSTAESPYSASKIAGESFIYSYSKCYDLPYLVFRFSNVYGRYDSDLERMERVIPLFIKKVLNNESITIYGREKMLDFTYVDDCIDGIVLAIDAIVYGKINKETINIAYGQGSSLVDLVDIISKFLKKEPNVVCESSRPGEVTHYIADISKARDLLGYSPKCSLYEGVQKSIQWQTEYGLRST